MDQFKKESMFSENLDEFDNARESLQELVNEYTAATRPDYLTWGSQQVLNFFLLSFYLYKKMFLRLNCHGQRHPFEVSYCKMEARFPRS